MKVYQIHVGNMQNFTYVVEDSDTAEAIIIDPSWNLEMVDDVIHGSKLNIRYIVNTHHHFDHTTGNEYMAESTGAPIVQHEASELQHDTTVEDRDMIEFGRSSLQVLHTPGHSKDSICLVGDGKIFAGDTLFVGSCGRVDLPGGSAEQLYHSLFDVLYPLDDRLVLYPGHHYGTTQTSTMGKEKATNPVMQRRTQQQFVEIMGR